MKPTLILLLFCNILRAQNPVISAVAGEPISASSAVYISASNGMIYNAVNTSPAMAAQAFSPSAIDEDESGEVYLSGVFSFETDANPPGTYLYMHPSYSGVITATKPTGAYQIVGIVAYDDQVLFTFQPRQVPASATSTIASPSSPQTLTANVDNLIDQGSTQSSFTFNLPSVAYDGDIVAVTFNNAVTTLTVDGNGHTLSGTALTTAAVGTHAVWKYYSSASKWIRQQ